ncbi:MAG: TonB-dependent receptor [Steroidobacteraceae bacterium]|nr:TonB-dependent receptor [Steroidobacteraceae bacterium]
MVNVLVKFRTTVVTAVAIAGLVASGGAVAQSGGAAAANSGELGEIVVTAQKRAERLQEVPAAVAVYTGAQLERSAAINMEGMLNQIPGVTFHKGDIPFNTSLFLRGVGTINFALGAEPSVGYVLDGVVMGTSGQAFGDLFDVARIEVIPGPQGTLFGKNSSAGVINVVSVMPRDTYDADVNVSYFEGNEQRTRASVDLPISNTFLTRTTVFLGRYDGNLTNLYQPSVNSGTSKINGYDHRGIRSIWKWNASDALKFTFIGDWSESNDNCCAFVTGTPPGTPAGTSAPIAGALQSILAGSSYQGDKTRTVDDSLVTQSLERQRGLSLQTDWSKGGYTLTNILAYRYWWFNEIREGDNLPVVAAYVGGAFGMVHDIGPQTTSTLTEEIRIASPAHQFFEYVGGLFYYHDVQNRYFQRNDMVCNSTTLAPDATGLAPCQPGSSSYSTPMASATFGSTTVSVAAYGQGTLHFTKTFRGIVGLRETHDELTEYHDYTLSPVGGGGVISANCTPQPGCLPFQGNGSTSKSNLSGKIGVQWDATPDEMTYATVAKGYKGPAYNVYFNQNNLQAAPLAPETSTAYEFGLKSTLLDGDAYLNADVFREEFNNFQANSPTVLNGVVITQLTNAGSVVSQGFELTGAARVSRAWDLNGGITYADAHVTKFNSPAGANPFSVARSGSALPFAPKFKGNLGTDYTWSAGLPFDVTLASNYSYQSVQYADFATCTASYCPNGGENPYLRLHGYGMWNASLAFSDHDHRMSVTALVKNIGNTSYASFAQTGGPGGSIQYFIPRDASRYYGIEFNVKVGGRH